MWLKLLSWRAAATTVVDIAVRVAGVGGGVPRLAFGPVVIVVAAAATTVVDVAVRVAVGRAGNLARRASVVVVAAGSAGC